MTKEQEIKQQITQAEQDEITLDYEKWQAQQIKANLPSHYVFWSEERDAVLQRQRLEKDTARQNHLHNLKVERRAESRENDSELNSKLTTELNRLRKQWLIDNPHKTEVDFEKVRHFFKELLVEQLYAEALNEQLQALNKKP